VYCRLGFAFKKGVEVFKNSQESSRWHPSWNARLVDKMKYFFLKKKFLFFEKRILFQ